MYSRILVRFGIRIRIRIFIRHRFYIGSHIRAH